MVNAGYKRHSLRLPGYDDRQPGAYFITMVSRGRALFFAEESAGSIVCDAWRSLPDRYLSISLDEFVVMPNHVHGIIIINDVGAGSPRLHSLGPSEATAPKLPVLGQIVAYFKYEVAKRINMLRGTVGSPVWQRGYYDHVVRTEAELGRVREYIRNNPDRWDLDRENPANTERARRPRARRPRPYRAHGVTKTKAGLN